VILHLQPWWDGWTARQVAPLPGGQKARDGSQSATPGWQMEPAYLGPAFTDDQIRDALDRGGLIFTSPSDFTATIADQLSARQSCGVVPETDGVWSACARGTKRPGKRN